MAKYKMKHRTIIVGGHESWLREVRPRLGGKVSYIGREQVMIDDSAITNAELIWMQPNALSHRVYNRIINSAKSAGVAVKFFNCAGVLTCLDQVIKTDKEYTI